VRGRGGQLVSDPAQVGGWPRLAAGAPLPDADHDGLPDAWEASHGLDPEDPSDRNEDYDRDGYTELEEYLNELAASLVAK
jgi:pectate lyase